MQIRCKVESVAMTQVLNLVMMTQVLNLVMMTQVLNLLMRMTQVLNVVVMRWCWWWPRGGCDDHSDGSDDTGGDDHDDSGDDDDDENYFEHSKNSFKPENYPAFWVNICKITPRSARPALGGLKSFESISWEGKSI